MTRRSSHRAEPIAGSYRRTVLYAGGTVFSLRVIGALLALAFNIGLARELGPDSYGLFTLALTAMTAGSVIAQLGLNHVAVRFVAASMIDPARAKWVGQAVVRWTATASMLVAVAMFILAAPIAERAFGRDALIRPLQVFALTVVPFSVLAIQGDALRGLSRFWQALLVQSVVGPAVSLVLLETNVADVDLQWASLVYACGIVTAFTAALGFWRLYSRQVGSFSGSVETLSGEMARMARPLFSASVLGLALTTAAPISLGMWSGAEQVGLYFVAARFTSISTMLFSAISSVVSPTFAALYAAGNAAELRARFLDTSRVMAIVGVAVSLALIGSARPLMALAGDTFKAGSGVLIVLMVGQLVVLATGPASVLLMMTGSERLHQRTMIVAVLMHSCLIVLLVPAHGAMGAAWATTVALLVENVLALVLAIRSAPWDKSSAVSR